MIRPTVLSLFIIFTVLSWPPLRVLHAADMREAHQKKAALLEKARLEKEQARQEAEQSRMRRLADRRALSEAVAALEARNKGLQADIAALDRTAAQKEREVDALAAELKEADARISELVGFVRTSARDLHALLKQSHQTALNPRRLQTPEAVMEGDHFPGMNDIRRLVDALWEEVNLAGQVRLLRHTIMDRGGRAAGADILLLGNFTAAYRLGDETGFLNYDCDSRKLFALSKAPPARMAGRIAAYMDGESDDVPVDHLAHLLRQL